MSEEELNEAIEYNLEYMEAMQSEEIFGGDYTSQVELKYLNKSINRLQQENQSLKEQVDYLRRSIERKEETIIELEQERVPYTNEYVDKLKKQLEEYKQEKQEWINLLSSFKNQQKEFIEYLEEEIKRPEEIDESKISQCSITTIRCMKSDYKEILSRYKETIGDKDEKDNNNI